MSEYSDDLIARLAAIYAKTFFTVAKDRKPLKVGIGRDLREADTGLSDRELNIALAHYTRGLSYLKSMREGAPRIGLNGEAAGTVTAGEAQHAIDRTAGIRKKLASRQDQTPPPSPAPAPEAPKRLSLADLRAAALARKNGIGAPPA